MDLLDTLKKIAFDGNPLSERELDALAKEAEPQIHLPCFGIRRDVLARLVGELIVRREMDEPARKLDVREDADLAGFYFNRFNKANHENAALDVAVQRRREIQRSM